MNISNHSIKSTKYKYFSDNNQTKSNLNQPYKTPIKQNIIYAPNNIYLMCIKGYFRKGEELGVYEYISQSMNHLNYIYDIR